MSGSKPPPDDPAVDKIDPHSATVSDVTHTDGRRGAPPTPTPVTIEPAEAIDATLDLDERMFDDLPARYRRRELLGIGGMGEVALHKDDWIGRSVALKRLLTDEEEGAADTDPVRQRRRFLREMRVQGQLEHPAIVPVYDFGRRANGALYFTMRRVRGPTLHQILDGLWRKDLATVASYSRRKLLTAFVSVCLAVHYAHTRRVIHRDLKPANIMLGEFGEVYVLDWGIAKVLASQDNATPLPASDVTQSGALVGTPKYMSPEQLLGKRDAIDARSDVYALGLILYELLVLQPMHKDRPFNQIVSMTLDGLDRNPSSRAPDSPPELDAICARALALDPAERWTSAQEMAGAIERYLDGDRDLERRRALAVEHAALATRAIGEAAEKAARGDDAQADRAAAMQEAVRALAFDPTEPEAARALARLMLEVPERMPAEVETEIAAAQKRARAESAKMGMFAFLAWLLFTPFIALMGVRSWTVFAVTFAMTVAAAGYAAFMWRRAVVTTLPALALKLLAAAIVGMMSFWLGPFVLVPTAAAIITLFFTGQARPLERIPLIAVGVGGILWPFALELLHVLPPSFLFEGGRLVLLPRAIELSPLATLSALVYTSVTFTVIPAILIGRVRDALGRAERQLFLHAWHFRRLLP